MGKKKKPAAELSGSSESAHSLTVSMYEDKPLATLSVSVMVHIQCTRKQMLMKRDTPMIQQLRSQPVQLHVNKLGRTLLSYIITH